MHQPLYKDTETGAYALPWVRLHAVKDYVHIARLIADYPNVHQTINVVPSLAEQLQEYGRGEAQDLAQAISARLAAGEPPSDEDRHAMFENFFSIHWDRFIRPNPRYWQLAQLRETARPDVGLFSEQYWLDLAVWFNLAWIDPSLRQADLDLRRLESKGRDFAPADLAVVLAAHRELCAQVVPIYRELADRGQLELTTSPFYHPILPLLIDAHAAREASPYLPLPHVGFAHPGDAATQVELALGFHRQTFGRAPSGMWPSEGAVSQATIDLLARYPNIRWIATDEHLLARARSQGFERDGYGNLRDPRPLYQPYRPSGSGPLVFFRDQVLSDRVGFVYQHWDSRDAANDLVERLLQAQRALGDEGGAVPPIVSIVLDGENCWEHYPNNGDDFLRCLFDRLSRETALRPVTPGEYVSRYLPNRDAAQSLARIPAGSWIGGNLETWIGEPDQNRAWEFLALARHRLVEWERDGRPADPERRRRAWYALRVAEGSDWFWWYYSHNRVGGEATFDRQFRIQLANVYRAIGDEVPDWLDRPVAGQPPPRRRHVTGPIHPDLTGQPEASSAWDGAGYVEPEGSTGAMQVGSRAFRRLYYGYDGESIFIRIELASSADGQLSVFLGDGSGDAPTTTVASELAYAAASAEMWRDYPWRIDVPTGRAVEFWRRRPDGSWEGSPTATGQAANSGVVELAVPRAELGVAAGAAVRLRSALSRDGVIAEAIPTARPIVFHLDEAASI
jgi:alpha-amylase/alpha-mannosidase (GH57 family)